MMEDHGHNFLRFCQWMTVKGDPYCVTDRYYDPLPYLRTGPALTLDNVMVFSPVRQGLYEEYEIDNIGQLLFLEIEQIIKSGTMIKRCRHCKRYFVVNNLIVEYCDRIAAGETQPCCDIGSKRSFQKKLGEDYPLKIYNRAYKTHYARIAAKKMTRAEFNEWCVQARGKLEEARAGALDEQSFEKWLKI